MFQLVYAVARFIWHHRYSELDIVILTLAPPCMNFMSPCLWANESCIIMGKRNPIRFVMVATTAVKFDKDYDRKIKDP